VMVAHAGQNVEVIGRMLEAVAREDRDGFLGFLSRDVEWDDREGWPGVAQMYHGHDGVRKWWEAFRSVGGEILDVQVEGMVEGSGSRVLLGVLGTFRGSTGAEFKARAWYVFWLREGKVSRAQLFWNRPQALEAAGLLEQEQGTP
jgi:ketosteroid isomerase-like protein